MVGLIFLFAIFEAITGGVTEDTIAPLWSESSDTVLRCHAPEVPLQIRVVVGVKTNRFYHSTRAVALWEAWGHRVGYGLTFVSDAPLREAADWSASVVVVEDEVDAERVAPYVPPWRDSSVDVDAIDPFSLPQLTRRVAALLEAMYACWANRAEWYIIVDDDTFVRPELFSVVLAEEDSAAPAMIGIPTNSDRFTLPEHQERFGSSVHCGGSSIILSRGLLKELKAHLNFCLDGPPRTTLSWYWDEVELLGRCVYELFQVNCTAPTVPQAQSIWALKLNLGPILAVKGKDDLDLLQAHVSDDLDGEWARLPCAFVHPIEAPEMRWLGKQFDASSAEL